MKMDSEDDILLAASRRNASRKAASGPGAVFGSFIVGDSLKPGDRISNSLGAGLNNLSSPTSPGTAPAKQNNTTAKKYPSDAVLRIDNFTTGENTPSPTPMPLTPSPTIMRKTYEPKGFLKTLSKAPGSTAPFLEDDLNVSRNSLPPLINVEVKGTEVAALLHSACHVSFISARLVARLNLKKDVQNDVVTPSPPLAPNGSGSAWMVEGRMSYIELSLKGTKHVAQLYVGRDLPADVILGVDFLRKSQVTLDFPSSCATLPAGVRLPFLSTKEVSDLLHDVHNQTRAYSSNF